MTDKEQLKQEVLKQIEQLKQEINDKELILEQLVNKLGTENIDLEYENNESSKQ